MQSNSDSAARCPHAAFASNFNAFDVQDPFPFYKEAREQAPIFYSEDLDYWIVTRYDDIKAVFKHHDSFSSEITQKPYKPRPEAVSEVLKDGFKSSSGLSGRMPPEHTRLRNFINKAFSPKRINALEPAIRKLANDYVDSFISKGKTDIVQDFVYEFPALVIFMLLGVPNEDVADVKRWAFSRVMLNFGDLTEEEQVEHAHNVLQFQKYCLALIEKRFENPTDDLAGDLVRIYQAGDTSITKEEMAGLCYTQLTAGHETTSNLLGNGIMELLKTRDQWEQLCEDSNRIPNAINELLRIGPSVFAWRRLVKKPTEVGGVKFQTGDQILMLLGSANRDEDVFEDGERLDISRSDAKNHMAFGYGIHYCLGSSLAKLEIQIVLETLTKRMPSLRLAPEQTFAFPENTTFRGPMNVHVEWDLS